MQNNVKDLKECEDGWDKIIYPIIEAIEEYNADTSVEPVEILQIKQKFGSLRFYVSHNAPQKIIDMISDAEYKSMCTCEWCGSEENVGMSNSNGWLRTLCSKCFEHLLEGNPNAKIRYNKPI